MLRRIVATQLDSASNPLPAGRQHRNRDPVELTIHWARWERRLATGDHVRPHHHDDAHGDRNDGVHRRPDAHEVDGSDRQVLLHQSRRANEATPAPARTWE